MGHRWFALSFALAACGRHLVDDEIHDVPLDVAPPDGDGSVACRGGLAACSGKCVDLDLDDGNCGACGHACKQPERFGHCEAGACPSALYCSARNTSLRSCHDVCAAHGQQCDEWSADASDRGCAGDRFSFYDASGEPGGAFLECELGFEPYETYAECSEEIDWQIFADTEPFTEAVACCCTQDP